LCIGEADVYEERILARVGRQGWLGNGTQREARGAMQQPSAAAWYLSHIIT